MRAALEAMRKALVGKLTEREFDKLRRQGEKRRAVLIPFDR